MSAAAAALIWCPFPDAASARAATATLLAERLVACGNILPAMQSLFVWEDTVQSADEAGLLLKTSGSALDRAIARLAELHPYDTPAIIGWRADSAAAQTLAWLDGAVTGRISP